MSRKSTLILLFLIVSLVPSSARAGGKLTAHGIYMIPSGTAAKDVSRPGWGLGGDFIIGLPNAKDIINGVIGLEYINLLGKSVESEALVEGVVLPYTKETDQWYSRLYVGAQAGGLGNAFLRPYAGLHAALVVYAINTDLNFHPPPGQEEFTSHAYDDIDAVFGFDLTFGMDVNISQKISLDGGVKYLKSFNVPDQLGEGAVRIYPQYFQVYLGLGIAITSWESEQE